MCNLFELIALVKPQTNLMSGKMRQLVEGVLSELYSCKEDVVSDLFKDNIDAEQSYRKLANRTEKHLTYLLLTTHSGETKHQKAYQDCWANLAKAMMLFGKGAKQHGVDIARKTISKAEQYEFIYIIAPLINILEKHFAYVAPDRRLYKLYSKAAKRNSLLIEIDGIANRYFSKIMMELSQRSSYTAGIINKLESYTEQLNKFVHPTVKVKYHCTVLEAIRCFAVQDYSRAALVCNEAVKVLEGQQAANNFQIAVLLHIRSVAAIAAGQYDNADSSLRRATQLAGKNPNSWQAFTYYRCICALHCKDYDAAYLLYKDAKGRKPSKPMNELWTVLNAYLYIFHKADQLYAFGDRFRLGRFFNETVEVSQDKAGTNVNIIIADLIISLFQNRDRFLRRIEPVRNYVYRHLRGKATERARLFLELLFLIPKHDFDPHQLERAANSICLKLKRRSVYANHNLEIEIVPFEELWEVTLELMGRGKMSSRKIGGSR